LCAALAAFTMLDRVSTAAEALQSITEIEYLEMILEFEQFKITYTATVCGINFLDFVTIFSSLKICKLLGISRCNFEENSAYSCFV
jgi:hypothetical protein